MKLNPASSSHLPEATATNAADHAMTVRSPSAQTSDFNVFSPRVVRYWGPVTHKMSFSIKVCYSFKFVRPVALPSTAGEEVKFGWS